MAATSAAPPAAAPVPDRPAAASDRIPGPSSPARARIVAGVLAALSTTAAVIGWVLFDTDPTLWSSGTFWPVRELMSAAVVYGIGGAWLIGYRRARWPAVILSAAGVCSGVALLAAGIWWTLMIGGDQPTAQPWNLINLALTNLSNLLIVMVLPQLYPDGPMRGRRWRILLAGSALIVTYLVVKPTYDIPTVGTPDEWFQYELSVIIVGWAISLAALAIRWWHGSRVLRRQIIGFAVVIVLMMYAMSLGTVYPYAQPSLIVVAAPIAIVTSIAVAVFRDRLYDVRLVIRRFAVYGVLTAALTALFVAVYLAVTAVAGQLAEGPYRFVAAAAATGAVVLVEPLRRRLQARLERRLLGYRGDPLRALARMHSAITTGDTDEHEIYPRIAQTVAEAVQAPAVALAVQRGPELEVVARSGVDSEGDVSFPLIHRGERLGELRVASRTPGESYGRADRALLDELASQTSALVYGIRRDADLRAARRSLVTSVADERRRLGRDLHDGIAPLLAGAGLTAEALRQGMPAGSTDERDAARLAERLRTAAGEVRRLAHDLQPAAVVGERGLAGAVENFVAGLSGPGMPTIQVHCSGDRRLPDEVEQVAYLVILEAVHNVVRHAGATRADVAIAIEPDELMIKVTDDGRGLETPYVAGIGVTSMRSRVQSLGGVFTVENGDRGAVVQARIPVAEG